ncbi:MAG: aconitate hydratase AcnA [Deltaproteobacteria bacterium]|nr:aconitate hydratase AcnA [Deltaproteobacteria bacterium]
MTTQSDAFGARARLAGSGLAVDYYRLGALAKESGVALDRLPVTVKILLENVLRHQDKPFANAADVLALARWNPAAAVEANELPFLPSRVVLQDFTGVPAVVDLAAMRDAVARAGGNPERINPLVPADLVIDHSVQVDFFGSKEAFAENVKREYERNRERYLLLRWGQKAFENFRVVPPSTGIVHQVNLEYLASVVDVRSETGGAFAFPDTLVGTDSHTTMINGLGVLGWGVGGIEAEAVLLGQPLYQLLPVVVGCDLTGQLPPGTTATDLVLTLTQVLRTHGVVGKFVEFFGAGCADLGLADRATLSNMAPEYGATAGLFPVDDETLRYLRATGRDTARVDLVERYCKEQGLFRTAATAAPTFSEIVTLDLSTVEPSLAGPRRPQDRVPLGGVRQSFRGAYEKRLASGAGKGAPITRGGDTATLTHGGVVIAAITSCTNTSNPSVMLAAGLLAEKAVARGLTPKPYVKTSLAPGSRVVTEYLRDAGVLGSLEALKFDLVGYGCTTCIGNSGPLPDAVAAAVKDNDLVVAAVLSGNRNFEGRIHPQVRAAYLASPPLVVAYALAGSVDADLTKEPLGTGKDGKPVFLKDVWPTNAEVREAMARAVTPELFRKTYAEVFTGDPTWQSLPVPEGNLYAWEPDSTYIQEPSFFADLPPTPQPLADIAGARVLAMLGDSVTTDHISPAGSIPKDGPAGLFLVEHGVEPRDFNSFGARRGNHQVMVRGTFGNVRLRNELVGGKEGDWTLHLPDGVEMRIFQASEKYRAAGTPLVIVAGKEYGSGSSRDWAAKGTLLLGVKAVIAESYERIHRSNLVGMGVVPLQFEAGQSRTTLGLDGLEVYAIEGLGALTPRKKLTVRARRADGSAIVFTAIARVDSPIEVDYLRHGGILQMVLRNMARG